MKNSDHTVHEDNHSAGTFASNDFFNYSKKNTPLCSSINKYAIIIHLEDSSNAANTSACIKPRRSLQSLVFLNTQILSNSEQVNSSWISVKGTSN